MLHMVIFLVNSDFVAPSENFLVISNTTKELKVDMLKAFNCLNNFSKINQIPTELLTGTGLLEWDGVGGRGSEALVVKCYLISPPPFLLFPNDSPGGHDQGPAWQKELQGVGCQELTPSQWRKTTPDTKFKARNNLERRRMRMKWKRCPEKKVFKTSYLIYNNIFLLKIG